MLYQIDIGIGQYPRLYYQYHIRREKISIRAPLVCGIFLGKLYILVGVLYVLMYFFKKLEENNKKKTTDIRQIVVRVIQCTLAL